jgi:hypothetical protein
MIPRFLSNRASFNARLRDELLDGEIFSNRSDIVYGARTVGGETGKRRSTFGQSDGLDSG